ncbi:hypothetical protein HII17_11935 [Thalassotalea sp. M1531]|uniref:Tetratricopeptide repeat protein n=1 Tax=Thalassotalea algicola TaxID=2716224 RepID=A0A7Y0LCX5_9GAMM|nr:hypothetical protein [Thalassotalea algicola]NMP32280.1 hypothetical protein [Thalassotalea algicola]
MKKFLAKASLLATLVSVGTSAVEATTLTQPIKLNGLKIAIIKNAVGTDEIISGDYSAGLSKIVATKKPELSNYDKAMGVCVASLKLNELDKADSACTKAIDEISAIKGRGRHGEFLKSMAYSNRAIVRYLAKDNTGALEDFTSALVVDNNSIVKDNILALKRIQLTTDDASFETSYAE